MGAREDLLKELESMSEEQLAQLAPEEIAEIEQLAQGRQEEAPLPQEGQPETEVSTMEAAGLGAVEGVPFAKDVAAGAKSIYEMATNEDTELSIDSFTEGYNRNLKEINDVMSTAEKNHPAAFFAGDVASGLATTAFIPGGILAKVGTSAAIGAAEGVSRSKDRQINDALAGAAIGAVSHGVGKVVGEGASYLGAQFAKVLPETVKEAIGIASKKGNRQLSQHLARTGQNLDEFAEDVLSTEVAISRKETKQGLLSPLRALRNFVAPKSKNGKEKLFSPLQTFDDTFDKVSIAVDQKGSELSTLMKKANLPDDVIEGKDLERVLKSKLTADMHASKDDVTRKAAHELDIYIRNITKPAQREVVEEVAKDGSLIRKITEKEGNWEKFSLSDVWSLQKDIRSRISQVYTAAKAPSDIAKIEMERKVTTQLGKVLDEMLDKASSKTGVDLEDIKKVRRQFGNLSFIEDSLKEKSFEIQHGMVGGLKQLFSIRSGVVGVTAMAAGVPPQAAIAIGIGLNRIAADPRTPAAMVTGVRKVRDLLQKDPNHKLIKRLILSSNMSIDAFRESLGATLGELSLGETPINRTTDDAKRRMNSILSIAEYHDKPTAAALRLALEEDNDEGLAAALDTISKMPQAKKFFVDGVGFNGKVYSPEDKAILEEQVKGSNLSLAQEMKLLRDLRRDGIVPQPVPDQRPTPQFMPRDKRKHNY